MEKQQKLTKKQIDTIALIANGKTNKMIALAHGVSPGTIDSRVSTILFKLNAATRSMAVSEAYKRGLLIIMLLFNTVKDNPLESRTPARGRPGKISRTRNNRKRNPYDTEGDLYVVF